MHSLLGRFHRFVHRVQLSWLLVLHRRRRMLMLQIGAHHRFLMNGTLYRFYYSTRSNADVGASLNRMPQTLLLQKLNNYSGIPFPLIMDDLLIIVSLLNFDIPFELRLVIDMLFSVAASSDIGASPFSAWIWSLNELSALSFALF